MAKQDKAFQENQSTTSIRRCGCRHPSQDSLFGVDMRVHNLTLKGSTGQQVWRCTVCGKERS